MADPLAHHALYYGLDIGGTKIELVAFDHALEARYRRRIGTPTRDYDAFIAAIVELVTTADAELGERCRAVGIGLPGVRDRDGRQLSSNVPALTGRRVAPDLQACLQRPLFFGNDCQCFALSEAHGGNGDGYPSMFGAILGTGAGGGYCIGGHLVGGHNGIAGEWGHCSIPAVLLERHALPLLDCACGLRGCIERYVSGSGLAILQRQLGGDATDANAVIDAAAAGEAVARRALEVHRDLLGYALASLVLNLDPDVIVLGGGLSKFEPLYPDLPAAVSAHLFAGVDPPPILPPRFGDAGGARGAAVLARQSCLAS